MDHFYRGNKRPHWQPPGATYFVTARLFGSIPKPVIEQLKAAYQLALHEIQFLKIIPENADVLLPQELIQDLKKYTGRQSNRLLHRNGNFREEESYDHWLRPGEFDRVLKYILNNPVKAQRVKHWQDHPWTYCNPSILHLAPEHVPPNPGSV